MKKLQVALAILAVTGVSAAPFAAEAKSKAKHSSTMSSKMTKPDASGQGGSGPGSDQGGTMTKTK